MASCDNERTQGALWSYLKLTVKVVLSDPLRFITHGLAAIKYYGIWKRTIAFGGSPLVLKVPWTPFSFHDFLKKKLCPESVIFEYGSGGSTFFFSRHGGHIYSIEHDQEWFGAVKEVLKSEGFSNVHYSLILPESETGTSPINYCPFGYEGSGFPGKNFYSYASFIDRFDDERFDLVMVDGRARNACVWHARRKIKPGGLLVLDNLEREHYIKSVNVMKGWEYREFRGVVPYIKEFCITGVWRRPLGPTDGK